MITPEHALNLAAHAVDLDLAHRLGVFSATTAEDLAHLPEPLSRFRNLPALVFPWTSPDGRVEYQIRPDHPNPDPRTGRLVKYRFRSKQQGYRPVLWAVQDAETRTALLVEGSKQTLAAASCLPDLSVYGMVGCWGWSQDRRPIRDLRVLRGKRVVAVLDADAATNPKVYDAGLGLTRALQLQGARRVRFARVPGAGKEGLDDVLARTPRAERADLATRLIFTAQRRPADATPDRRAR
jgi:hypothetical protein